MDAVAVSYAQDGIEYNEQVMGFVDLLRKEYGYNAIMDQMFKQDETAVDFNEMMSKLIVVSNKVIVVLSIKYKQRADAFEGGVGKEYRIILDEIEKKTKKYIFITFDSLKEIDINDIKPSALGNREIIEMTNQEEQWNVLLAKISDNEIYSFSEVAKDKRKPIQKLAQFKQGKNKHELFRSAQILLTENKQILDQYGPDSLIAINNPLSSTVKTWNNAKTDSVIPNNRKIIQEFEKSMSVLSIEEIRIFKKYKIHAEAFEVCQRGEIGRESVPIFPVEFENMINEEEHDA